jgi:hypothetical protein
VEKRLPLWVLVGRPQRQTLKPVQSRSRHTVDQGAGGGLPAHASSLSPSFVSSLAPAL